MTEQNLPTTRERRAVPEDDEDPVELTLTRGQIRALLCPRQPWCPDHGIERNYAAMRLRDALDRSAG